MRQVLTLIAVLLCTSIMLGQTNKGGISGTVLDASGGAIPGASVTITNLGTNQAVTVTTTETGSFSAALLDPVTYSVAVEASGFKRALVQNVKVDTATTATVNVTIEPGGLNEQVTVTSESQLLNTESGTTGQTITERQIVEMPLNNRSVLDLALTVANVSGVAGTEDPELSDEIPAPGFNLSINGGRPGTTSILADGANNTGVGLARALVTFSPDTVQEFKVETSNFSAQFGQTGGGVINMTTKSGTNNYEGLFYWYHRNPALNAAPFTTNVDNRPQSTRRQHQFGLTYGGPVRVPKIYDGRDRTFFFVAFEPRYYYQEEPITGLLPTEAMLQGDFTNVVRVTGGHAPRDVAERFGLQNQIADATLYRQFDLVNGNQFVRMPLPASGMFPRFTDAQGNPVNIIPKEYLDPVSQQLLKYLPTRGDYFIDDGELKNYVDKRFVKNLDKRMSIKIDHHLTGNNLLTGRYTQVPIRGDRGHGNFQVGRDEINADGTDYSWSKQILLTDTHTFSPSLINELRLNYTYGRFTRNLPPMFDAQTGRNFSTELGLPSLTVGALPSINTGVATIGYANSQQNENNEHSFGIASNLSWVKGNRTWKFGVDLMQQRLKTIPIFGASGGRYEFQRNRSLTNINGNNNGSGGIEFAQFLLGTYNQAVLREVLIPYYYQWNSGALYVQQDWKVKSNLTLNLGLRYSLQLPRTEKFNRQGAFRIDLTETLPLPQSARRAIAIGLGLLPTNAAADVAIPDGTPSTTLVAPFVFAGEDGQSRYLFPVQKSNFEPRFGFAWVPKMFGWNDSGKLVLRGGYGLSHVPLTGLGRNPSPDFAAGTTEYGTFDNRVTNPGFVTRIGTNPPVISAIPPETYLSSLADINVAATAISDNTHVPYVQSWSASLAYELPQSTVVELSYNGGKGTHLFSPPININSPPFAATQAMRERGLSLADDVNDPLGRLGPTGALRRFDRAILASPYLGYPRLDVAFDASGNSIRHAGTISVRRRHTKGLSYTMNYTYGKGIDEASDSGSISFVNLNIRSPGHVNYGAPRHIDRAVSQFDVKHAFSTTFLYDLPFGRGRTFLSRAPGIVEQLFGGWSLSGVGRIQSALPLVTVIRDDNQILGSSNNQRAIRPDLVPGVPLLNPRYDRSCPIGDTCEPYFNPAAFMRPVKGILGNAPRTFDGARGPSQRFLDLSVQKNFALDNDGKRRLQIRVDAINVLNHPIFRTARLEDGGEIFVAPNEGTLSTADYDNWQRFDPVNRHARSTPEGAALFNDINNRIRGLNINPNRAANPNAIILPSDFFHVPVPEGFHSMNANSFNVNTVEGLKLYRLRQAYTADRWGFLTSGRRSGYDPRFIQFALKFYF